MPAVSAPGMKRFLISGLLCTVPVFSQTYDFSAATAQLAGNLNLYGNRVVAIVEQEKRGEIFRYEAGAITQNTKLGIASCSKWLSGAVVLAYAERGYFRLDDRLGDYLVTSPDCGTWTPLAWASIPFLESLVRPPGSRWFCRLRR